MITIYNPNPITLTLIITITFHKNKNKLFKNIIYTNINIKLHKNINSNKIIHNYINIPNKIYKIFVN